MGYDGAMVLDFLARTHPNTQTGSEQAVHKSILDSRDVSVHICFADLIFTIMINIVNN